MKETQKKQNLNLQSLPLEMQSNKEHLPLQVELNNLLKELQLQMKLCPESTLAKFIKLENQQNQKEETQRRRLLKWVTFVIQDSQTI